MTRQGKIKESQPHQCNERTQLLLIALERPYDGSLLVAGGRAHVHWQPNNIRLGWSGDLKREKRAQVTESLRRRESKRLSENRNRRR